jgi:pimeloyl-ACP methyl ester carboxylesterase
MHRVPLLLALLVLTACVPVAQPEPPTAIIDGARFDTVAFGTFETAYETVGSGRPVVMVHGIGGGSSLFQYRLNAPVVAEAGHRVFALDLLGFGRSSRPAIRLTQDVLVAQLEGFLTDAVGEPAVVVANGLSAAYAIRLAAERPDLIAGLVLIAPTGYERLSRPMTPERVRAFETFRGPLGEVFAGLLVDEGSQRFFLLDAYAREESLTPEVLATYDRNLKVEGARWAIFSFVTGNLDQPVDDLWPSVEQPTLIVWGTEAQTTPLADAEDFVLARPETSLLPLTGAKLLPNEERAGAFNEAVLRFLARTAD